MDISLALKRFNSLQSNTKKSDSIWKPANGKSLIRIVPYKFNKDIPFIELYFHYNINNKTYLSIFQELQYALPGHFNRRLCENHRALKKH